ncbi:MAG TPA: hypothetical protein VLV76_25385 [Candidatus Acidoferrum sp.]|nr:hypothetical protein [Candidatus Acidoferrum sp.]
MSCESSGFRHAGRELLHTLGGAEIGGDTGDRRPLHLAGEPVRGVQHRLFAAAVDDDVRPGRR